MIQTGNVDSVIYQIPGVPLLHLLKTPATGSLSQFMSHLLGESNVEIDNASRALCTRYPDFVLSSLWPVPFLGPHCHGLIAKFFSLNTKHCTLHLLLSPDLALTDI